jgi:hypothetical protein
MTTCAICASEREPFTIEPLGRDNAMISVCAACSEPVFEKSGPFIGYEPTGGMLSKPEVMRGARKVMGSDYDAVMRRADDLGRGPSAAPPHFPPSTPKVRRNKRKARR